MKHREKLRIARRLAGPIEKGSRGVRQPSIFDRGPWQERALKIRIKVKRREDPELIKRLGL